MDEDFFLYYEEVALCKSAQNKGWRVLFDPSISVVHLRPLQNRAISPKMRVITRHSKLLYFQKHLSRAQFLGLYAIIAVEAKIRGAWARLRRHDQDARSWQRIGLVARLMKDGADLRGRAVLEMAEGVVVAEDPPDRKEGWSL